MVLTKENLQKIAYTKDGCHKRRINLNTNDKIPGVAKATPFFFRELLYFRYDLFIIRLVILKK